MGMTNVKQHVQNLVGTKFGNYETRINYLDKNCNKTETNNHSHRLKGRGIEWSPIENFRDEWEWSETPYTSKSGRELAVVSEHVHTIYEKSYDNVFFKEKEYKIEYLGPGKTYTYDEAKKPLSLEFYKDGKNIKIQDKYGDIKGEIDLHDGITIDGAWMTIGDYLNGQ